MRSKLAMNPFLFIVSLSLLLSVVLSVMSLFPMDNAVEEHRVIIEDSFRLTAAETRRHNLGSFRVGENISIVLLGKTNQTINSSVIAYGEKGHSGVSRGTVEFFFIAEPNYY